MSFIPSANDFQNSGQPVNQSSGYTPSAQDFQEEKQPTIAEKLMNHVDTINAFGAAAGQGIASFGTTLIKGISKAGDAIFGTDSSAGRAKVQNYYDKISADAEQMGKGHPIASALGNVTGGLIGGAPLMAIPGAPEAAGIFGENAPGIAKLAAGVTGGAIQGAMFGGAMTRPGQNPEDVINTQGAKQGAEMGALLSPLQMAASSYGSKLDQYQNAKASINKEVNGTQLNFGANMGDPTASYVKGRSDKIVQSMPGILGNTGYLNARADNFQDYVRNYINAVSDHTVNESKQAIGNILDKTNQNLKSQYNDLWQSVTDAANNSNIKTIQPSINTTSLAKNLLNNYSDVLDKNLIKNLKTSDMSPQEWLNAKQTVWDNYEPLAKKIANGNATVEETQAAKDLRNLYFSSLNDFKNTVAPDENLSKAFATANTFTQGYKNLMDPQYNKQLVNAIDDLNDSRRGVTSFINWLAPSSLTSKTSSSAATERDVSLMMGVLGKEGQKELSNIAIRNLTANAGMKSIVSSAMDSDRDMLNLPKFIDKLNQTKSLPSAPIYADNINALQGLVQLGKNYLSETAKAPESGNVLKDLGIGAVGAGIATKMLGGDLAMSGGMATATGATIGLGTAAMSAIKAYAPLKNSLILLNKAAATSAKSMNNLFGTKLSTNPALSQYLLDSVSKNLSKAGIAIKVLNDGSIKFTTPDKENGITKPLNESSNTRYSQPISPEDSSGEKPPRIPHEKMDEYLREIDQGRDDYSSNKSKNLFG